MVKTSENNDNKGQYAILDGEDKENEDSSSGTDDQFEDTGNYNENMDSDIVLQNVLSFIGSSFDLNMAKELLESMDFNKWKTRIANLQNVADLIKNLDEDGEEYNLIKAQYEASVKEVQEALSVERNLLNHIGYVITEIEKNIYNQ